MPIPLLLLLLMGLFVASLFTLIEDKKKEFAATATAMAVLLAWLVWSLNGQGAVLASFDVPLATVAVPNGGAVQVVAVPYDGQPLLINLSDRFDRVFAEGERVRLVRRSEWVRGVYYPKSTREAEFELAPGY